jgi:hypothetical protein
VTTPRIVLWDSESDDLVTDTGIVFTRDYDGTLAMVIDCYELTGVHGRSSIIFVGPNAMDLAKKWQEFVEIKTALPDEDTAEAEAAAEDKSVDVNGGPIDAMNDFATWLKENK